LSDFWSPLGDDDDELDGLPAFLPPPGGSDDGLMAGADGLSI